MLRRYYSLNIPPVLCTEILGDLKKFDREKSKNEVRRLADKLVPLGSIFNVQFRSLIESEVGGQKLPMDGRAITAGKHVVTDDGKAGMFAETSPQEKALLRWQEGDFEAAEQILAAAWRQKNTAVDLEAVRREIKAKFGSSLNLPSLEAVAAFVEGLLDTPRTPQLYGIFLGFLGFHPNAAREMVARLERSSKESCAFVFPYTTFCLRAALLFAIGLGSGHVTTHHNTLVDLEYLFYVPFCDVFSSGDHFHRTMIPFLLTKKQEFIWGDELKSDLTEISKWWDRLNEQEHALELERSGPPENQSSRTHLIWQRLMGRGYRDRRKLNLTPESQKRLIEQLSRGIDNARDADGAAASSLDEKNFVVKKTLVRPDAPCFCGSKRIAKDCCFRYLSEITPQNQ